MENHQNTVDKLLEYNRTHYFGKYRGRVVNNNSKNGRLEVSVGFKGTEIVITAEPCLPYAGNKSGIYMIPEKDTEVWIEFERGDLGHPIWTGCIWPDHEMPVDEKGTPVTPTLKVIRSETGLMITMNDDKENQIITLCDEDGSNIITIEASQGKIKLKAKKTVVIEAPDVQLGGEGATQPVVMGLDLMKYLQALEAWVVPNAPIPPPSAVFRFLSSKVKTL